MKTIRVKMICDVDVFPDEDGGTIGAREDLAMRIEGLLAAGRVRHVEILPQDRRLTVRAKDGTRYAGECDYIPCDRRGKCLEGAACAGCAHADVLARMAIYEDILIER